MASYNVELFSNQNAVATFIADITTIAGAFNFSVPLNNFEELSFTMNLEGWKGYCLQTGLDPYLSIKPYTSEIRLKRNGVYLPISFEIKQAPKRYGQNDSSVSIQARGTLSKLNDALITKIYAPQFATDIARDIIAVRQAKTNGDFGITNGNTTQVGPSTERTYQYYNSMDAIRNLSDDADSSGGFDFWFDEEWKFYTDIKKGSVRTDVTFKFGGEDANVIEYENPEDFSVLSNDITIVGAGIGDPATGRATDATSSIEYRLRETALVFSNIDNQDWLDNRAAVELSDRKQGYDLPKIVVTGDVMDLNTYWVGDTIPIECTDPASPYLGMGRIKNLSVSVDINHQELISVECLKV